MYCCLNIIYWYHIRFSFLRPQAQSQNVRNELRNSSDPTIAATIEALRRADEMARENRAQSMAALMQLRRSFQLCV